MTSIDNNNEVKGDQHDSAPVFLYDALIVVLVGPEKQRFDLHRGLICKQSDFFKAALSGGFKEANGQTVLPEQDPETFKYFVNWLYTGRLRGFYYPSTMKPTIAELRVAVDRELVEEKMTEAEMLDGSTAPAYLAWAFANYKDANFHKLISLYTLADSLQVLGLKDPIISLLVEVYGSTLKTSASKGVVLPFWDHVEHPIGPPSIASSLNLAWEKLPLGSSMRKVLVLLFCDGVADVRALIGENEINQGFLACCLDIVLQRWFDDEHSTPWGEKGVVCKFHEHDVECTHILKSLKEGSVYGYDQLDSA